MERVYINDRKGFIKYALQYGYTIYPSYTFNENKIYSTFNYLESFRLWLNKFKCPGTIFCGKYGLWPRYDIEIVTVIGKGIEMPIIEKPTFEEVDKYHKIYVDSLKSIFERNKERYSTTANLEVL